MGAGANAAPTPLQDGRFLILEGLGRGGMGAVYRAFDRAEQRLVALKVVREDAPPGPAHPLAEEFRIWSRMCHPNIVEAYELGQAESGPISRGRPYLVLEHVAGRPVHRACVPPSSAWLEGLAAAVLDGLSSIHAEGYVHRDLKPANVLTNSSSHAVKLTDFGLAGPVGTASPCGTISGSLPYVSPEELLGLPVDGRADLYALGVLLHRLATGELPCRSRDPEVVVRWHLSETAADPGAFRPDLSARLCRLVGRLTARDRDDRPAGAREALRLLDESRRLRPIGPRKAAGRSERAKLRLALDAVRLGAWREIVVPAGGAPELARELRVWSQVRGLRVFQLASFEELSRVVLRLLGDLAGDAPALLRRFALDRAFSFELLGGVPLLGPTDAPHGPRAGSGGARTIIGVADFLAYAARPIPLVLFASVTAEADPRVRAVVARLARVIAARDRARVTGGGLLLVRTFP